MKADIKQIKQILCTTIYV